MSDQQAPAPAEERETPVEHSDERMKHLASAMRKMLPPSLLREVVKHLDPVTPFVEFLRSAPYEDLGDLERGCHNRDGWFFRRDSEDGNVRIWKVRWEHLRPVIEAGPHIIPENEWASIVASVSRHGETGTSWQFVRDFHNAEDRAVTAPQETPDEETEQAEADRAPSAGRDASDGRVTRERAAGAESVGGALVPSESSGGVAPRAAEAAVTAPQEPDDDDVWWRFPTPKRERVPDKRVEELEAKLAALTHAIEVLRGEMEQKATREENDNWCNTADAPIWRAIHRGRAEVYRELAAILKSTKQEM